REQREASFGRGAIDATNAGRIDTHPRLREDLEQCSIEDTEAGDRAGAGRQLIAFVEAHAVGRARLIALAELAVQRDAGDILDHAGRRRRGRPGQVEQGPPEHDGEGYPDPKGNEEHCPDETTE